MIDYKRLAEAETHPTRLDLLEALEGKGDVSTAELTQSLDSTTNHLTYHLGVLEGKGLVTFVKEEQVGPETHRYFRLARGDGA